MNTLILYYTRYGNTQKIAEAIGERLAQSGPTRLVNLEQLVPGDLAGIDLLIVGSPTYRMALPQEVKAILKGLPKRCLRGKVIAAYDTSYQMSPWLAWMTAAKSLSSRLSALGGKLVVPPETFYIHHNHAGPLFDGEPIRAQAWAEKIFERSTTWLERKEKTA